MSATFRVEQRFGLESRSLWVLAGTILSGAVRPGMYVRIPLNQSLTISEPVHGVEFVDGPNDQSLVGLTFHVVDPDDYMVWEMFPEVGEIVQLDASST